VGSFLPPKEIAELKETLTINLGAESTVTLLGAEQIENEEDSLYATFE
jgi:hypothetical protein